MSQSSQETSQSPYKSERVVQLLAACIRTSVRLRYARELSRTDSIDLARVHDLSAAMKTISAKMELHTNLPSDLRRFELAVNEAKLVSGDDLGAKSIIDIREASIAAHHSNQDTSAQRFFVVTALRNVEQEAISWGKAYSRFMTEIERLHKRENARIVGLHLPANLQRKAQLELEQIVLDAIGRAEEMDSTH